MPFVYDIGQCQRCGSNRTGRVLPAKGESNIIKKEIKQAQKGIYVKYSNDSNEYNCFCFDCGVMWRKPLEPKYISKAEYEKFCQSKISAEEEDYLINKEKDIINTWTQETGGKKKKKRYIRRFLKSMFISPFENITSVAKDAKLMMGIIPPDAKINDDNTEETSEKPEKEIIPEDK